MHFKPANRGKDFIIIHLFSQYLCLAFLKKWVSKREKGVFYMREARRLMVSGRVQGVGFRYFVQITAADYHVTGWVKNLDNGAVALHAESTAEQLDSFINHLTKGSHFARVNHIEEEPALLESFTSFRIKY
jgi:acylphosphatase